jgi:hypothetical protein
LNEGSNWSRAEVEATVAFYRDMLQLELLGKPFNKRERNLALQDLIERSAGSIEFKHQNISAILNQAGIPYISGYKPRGNFQGLLEEVVIQQIIASPTIDTAAAQAVAREEFQPELPGNLLAMRIDAPVGLKKSYSATHISRDPFSTKRKNYVELEARNSALGLAGENLVMQYEHARLWTAGQRALADKIEHVSRTRGDHLGYDIHSFDCDGKDRLIEVKTTQFGLMTPFFATSNEVNVSITFSDHYQVYRVFSFAKNPRLFALEGAIGRTCELTPVAFRAVPR